MIQKPIPLLKLSPVVQVICGGIFDVDNKRGMIRELEEKMAVSTFWNNQEDAQKVISQVNQLKQSINDIIDFQTRLDDLKLMCELVAEADPKEAEAHVDDIKTTIESLNQTIDLLELKSFLNGPHDHCNAIVSIHAGAGGTESCDWADMLLRMYTRWAEQNNFKVDVQDLLPGEEAGLSRATFSVAGINAYSFAKAERGVHRLVRISPFDSNARRHTSFCAVDVIAEVDEDIDIEIKPDDLRIDTFRSSGKGGQHANKTDSAIRITHMPTNIVVACQNERSQTKNKATAMKVLKSRLYEKIEDKKRAEQERFYSEKTEIAWGNQIRSYVFQPYQLVTDLRTGLKLGNVQDVMNGNLNPFIHAWLRKQK